MVWYLVKHKDNFTFQNFRKYFLQGSVITSCPHSLLVLYKGVSQSFRTGHLEQQLQMVQLSATRCSCTTILWVSLLRFTAITLCVASQQVWKLLDTSSYNATSDTGHHDALTFNGNILTYFKTCRKSNTDTRFKKVKKIGVMWRLCFDCYNT